MSKTNRVLDYASTGLAPPQPIGHARVILSLNLIGAIGLHVIAWYWALRGYSLRETGALQLSMLVSAMYIALAIVMACAARTGLLQLGLDVIVGGMLLLLSIIVLGVS